MIREAELQLANGLKIQRPLKIYPLEVSNEHEEDVNVVSNETEVERRSCRRAKTIANERIDLISRIDQLES